MKPTTLVELSDALRSSGSVRLVGSGSKSSFLNAPCQPTETLELGGLTGIEEIAAEDRYVTCLGGTPMAELQAALAEHGQTLPLPDEPLLAGLPGTVGGWLATNLPHALEHQMGAPRHWCLGMTVVRPDGSLAKSGGRTVKNVAGYDVHRFMVGGRGLFGVIGSVTLRTFALPSVPHCVAEMNRPWNGGPMVIQRVSPSDFDQALERTGDRTLAADPASSTLWGEGALVDRFDQDWIMRAECGAENWLSDRPASMAAFHKAKHAFDPDGRLNPDELPQP